MDSDDPIYEDLIYQDDDYYRIGDIVEWTRRNPETGEFELVRGTVRHLSTYKLTVDLGDERGIKVNRVKAVIVFPCQLNGTCEQQMVKV
jgi:hypothetical protein